MVGQVGILNVGAGDTKLSFDPSNREEVARASGIVTDMLRRGYALMVEVGRDDDGPLYRRAKGFDEKTAEYLIMSGPSDQETPNVEKPASPAPRGRQGKTQRIPAAKTSAVAVARSAGG